MIGGGAAGLIHGVSNFLGGADFGEGFMDSWNNRLQPTELAKDFHDYIWNVEDLKDLSDFADSTGLEALSSVGDPTIAKQSVQFISDMGQEIIGFIGFNSALKGASTVGKLAKTSAAAKYAEATANFASKPYAETIAKMVVEKTTNMAIKADQALARAGLGKVSNLARDGLTKTVGVTTAAAEKAAANISMSETAMNFTREVFNKVASGTKLTNAEKLYNLTATNLILRNAGMSVGAFYKASNGARAVASTLIRSGAPEAGAWLLNTAAKAIANGERFGLSRAIKVIPTAIKEAGLATGAKSTAKFGRLMEIAAMESKYTVGFMGFDLARMSNDELKDMFGHEDGVLDYVAQNFLMDAMFNAAGYGLAGPALRASRTKFYRGKLNKWEERKLEAAQGSEVRAKAEAKLTHYTEKANSYANRVVAESLIGDNTPALQQLVKQTDESVSFHQSP